MSVANVNGYQISEHVAKRWDERTPRTPLDATEAWMRALPLDHVSEYITHRSPPDEYARIYIGQTPDGIDYEVLFIRRGNAVITCYPYDGVGDSRVEAYIEKMIEQTRFYEST